MVTSVALKTNDIWSKTIGYNPYAAEDEEGEAEEEQREKALFGGVSRALGTFFGGRWGNVGTSE